MQIQLGVSPNRKSAYSPNTSNAIITSGSGEIITITPPTGYILKIIGLMVSIPAVVGAASGSHSVTIYGGNLSSTYGYYVQIANAYNAGIQIKGFNAVTYNTMSPTTEVAFILSLQGAEFSNSNPLCFTYWNGTNIATPVGDNRTFNVQYALIPETVF